MLNKMKVVKMVDRTKDCFAIIEKEENSDFIEKVNIGMRESAMGLVNTKEEAKLKLSKWLK